MIIRFFLIFLFCSAFSCSNMRHTDNAIIEGNIGKGKSGKIYLVDIAKKDVIKDSTEVKDGHFVFTYTPSQTFLPFEAMLLMWNNSPDKRYLRPLGYQNPYKSKYIESVFYVDRGTTFIDYKAAEDNFNAYTIKGSKQNEPYYRQLTLYNINKNQSITERERLIANTSNLIAKYPYSFYLLNMLYCNREQYTLEELKLLMDEFDDDAKALSQYSKLNDWINFKKKGGEINLAYMVLENERGKKEHILDTTQRINMLVFWASWCGPCRNEIPELKNLYLKYHSKGLSITSISLDNNKNHWQNALSIEKMPWKQLIANEFAKHTFDLSYNITTIPTIVLINGKNQPVQLLNDLSSKNRLYRSLSILDK